MARLQRQNGTSVAAVVGKTHGSSQVEAAEEGKHKENNVDVVDGVHGGGDADDGDADDRDMVDTLIEVGNVVPPLEDHMVVLDERSVVAAGCSL